MSPTNEALKGKKLAIIGGSYLQLPLVLRAIELGVTTCCFSWVDGAICKEYCDTFYPISILEKEGILEICREIEVDGITTIASDAAVPTVNYVAEKLGLVGNPYANSEQYVNKYVMRTKLAKANVSVPKFFMLTVDSIPSCNDRIVSEGLSLPIIIKPVDRSGSRGVFRVDSISQLESVLERAATESFSKSVIVEEFVEGREFSVETISWEGEHHLLAVTEKETTGAPYFVELAHHQPAALTKEETEKVSEFTLRSLSALEIINGASHTEIKITEDGVLYLIETGARMGGDFIGSDLVRLSTGYDFLAGVIQVALNSFNQPEMFYKRFSGVYFLSQETERLQNFIINYEEYAEIVKAEILNAEIKSIQSSSDRSGYMIYQAQQKFIP